MIGSEENYREVEGCLTCRYLKETQDEDYGMDFDYQCLKHPNVQPGWNEHQFIDCTDMPRVAFHPYICDDYEAIEPKIKEIPTFDHLRAKLPDN